MSELNALGYVAILWRGDQEARRSASPETNRFKAVFTALANVGVDAEPVVYEDASPIGCARRFKSLGFGGARAPSDDGTVQCFGGIHRDQANVTRWCLKNKIHFAHR